MRHSKLVHTLRVVIITSIFWLLVQCFLLFSTSCNEQTPSELQPNAGVETTKSCGIFARILSHILPFQQATGPGEMGVAVVIPEEKKAEMDRLFKINSFNLMASDIISVNRSLPDHRSYACQAKSYPSKLPDTSVVIVFHNEAWSTLLRTIHSVINKTPRHLLREIILVDDASIKEHLGDKLDDYIKKQSVPIHIERLGTRSGLIQARLRGAKRVKAATITFLDSHCECIVGWLEPLLAEVKTNRKVIASPLIDVIDDNTFEYIPGSDRNYGGFTWKMNFRWVRVPERENVRRNQDTSLPIRSPTIAGGLFTIDKNYFYEIGAYDSGMVIWGGENLELSFRVWMCGGALLIVPCSRVGHVFRETSPYTWPGGVNHILDRNHMRTVRVWMDDYQNFYYKLNPTIVHSDYGDVSERVKLRENLQCKSFSWYLENIYPESLIPIDMFAMGQFKHETSGLCLDTMGRKSGETLGMVACHGQGGNQIFVYSNTRRIQSDEACLAIASVYGPVKLVDATDMAAFQQFEHDAKTLAIKHITTNLCLTQPNPSEKDVPGLAPCDGSKDQRWIVQDMNWQKYSQSKFTAAKSNGVFGWLPGH